MQGLKYTCWRKGNTWPEGMTVLLFLFVCFNVMLNSVAAVIEKLTMLKQIGMTVVHWNLIYNNASQAADWTWLTCWSLLISVSLYIKCISLARLTKYVFLEKVMGSHQSINVYIDICAFTYEGRHIKCEYISSMCEYIHTHAHRYTCTCVHIPTDAHTYMLWKIIQSLWSSFISLLKSHYRVL